MVSLPDELVRELDQEARRRSTSRSALLGLAARLDVALVSSDRLLLASRLAETPAMAVDRLRLRLGP